MPASTTTPRAELHTHLGGAVDPPILWSIAHRQGIRLPTKDYWEFEAMVTMAEMLTKWWMAGIALRNW